MRAQKILSISQSKRFKTKQDDDIRAQTFYQPCNKHQNQSKKGKTDWDDEKRAQRSYKPCNKPVKMGQN